ncbi:MAG: glycosyltransferase family 2 protein [Acidiferrobacterales bacterium]
MSSPRPSATPRTKSAPATDEFLETEKQAVKPLVSVVVPAYNEAAITEKNLAILCNYMESLEHEYRWELIFINDGSTDNTGEIAEAFARSRDNVRVYHHGVNFGLGQAFKFGFSHCKGDYVITLDVDLSYSPDHVQRLLTKIRETNAKLVLASPYMKGGEISNVPWLRRTLSVWANRFLSVCAYGHLSTVTCMVRAYDGRFLRSLNLRSMGMDVMPETIYKTIVLTGRVEQIPAHLDWGPQRAAGLARRSSMRMLRHILSTVLSGFIFRPFMFFVIPGLLLLVFAAYVNSWMVIHFIDHFKELPPYPTLLGRASVAVAAAYQEAPHTFVIGLLSLMLSIQLISLGILALQSKHYFEEIFHFAATIYKSRHENHDNMPPSDSK